MARCRKGPRPAHHFVQGAFVGVLFQLFVSLFKGNQIHDGELTEQLFGPALCQVMLPIVPPASLNEESVYIAAEFWFFCDFGVVADRVQELELEVDFIDGNGFFAGIVLETASHESLREEETTHPE